MLYPVFPEAPVPRRIGEFAIVRRLRADGPFDSFLAREEGPMGFTRHVTLRSVRRDSGDPQHAAELAREARICARLSHPAIARVLGFFEEGDRLVLVLEHLDGTNLARLLTDLEARGEQLPDAAAAHIASSVASALAAAHALVDEKGTPTPVLHRAVSPGVVHVARDGTVKLGGFSLAKVLDRTPDSVIGFVRGAAGHLAPEQLRGEPATGRTDVWALGMLCYRLFAGTSAGDGVLQVMAGRPPSLASVKPGASRELSAALDAALQEDPKKRSITCAELAKWIARVASAEDGKHALRAVMESIPQDDEGEPAPLPDRASKRKVRAMQRQAPGVRMRVLRASRSGDAAAELDDEEWDPGETSEAPRVETAQAAAVIAKADASGRIDTAQMPSFDAVTVRRIEAAPTAPANAPSRRLGTMVGLGPAAPKYAQAKADPDANANVNAHANAHADANAKADAGARVGAAVRGEGSPFLGQPAAPSAGADYASAIAAVEAIATQSDAGAPHPGTLGAPAPPPPPVVTYAPGDRPKPALEALMSTSSRLRMGAPTSDVLPEPVPVDTSAFEETAMLPRARRSRLPIVIGVIVAAALLGVVAIVLVLLPKHGSTTEGAAASVDTPTKTTASSAEKPKASAPIASAPAPSTAPTATASGAQLVPPPGKKLPKEFGWVLVHGPVGNTRVMVAGKMRGEPEQVIAAPCGKVYVTLAIVNENEKWKGWAAKAVYAHIPCNGTVAEVTLKPLKK